jgi:hypothetical protein
MLVSQSAADTSKAGAASSSAVPVPKNMQYANKTTTPEFDAAPLFAAYRQFAQAEVPASTEYDNRYKAPENSASSAQPKTAAGTTANSVGYTQAVPTQQPAQANNYSLQPAQTYAPNTSLQQYQNQRYSTQQSPNQPQYGPQTQPNTLDSLQTPSSQERGVQVPYSTQPSTSKPSALQLPPGPIGGYGVQQTSPTGTLTGTQSNLLGGATTSGASNSLKYPSIQ